MCSRKVLELMHLLGGQYPRISPALEGIDIRFMPLPVENFRFCAGKRLYNGRLWFRSREFTTLQGYEKQV